MAPLATEGVASASVAGLGPPSAQPQPEPKKGHWVRIVRHQGRLEGLSYSPISYGVFCFNFGCVFVVLGKPWPLASYS